MAIGLMLGMLMVVPMFLVVHIGRHSDRAGFAVPAAAGLLLQLAAAIVVSAWPTVPGLFVASVLTGTGYMSAHVSLNNAVGQAAPQRTTEAFSTLAMGFSLSGLTGPLLAGVAIDHLGHTASFLVLGLFSLAALLVLQRARRRYTVRPAAPSLHRDARVLDLLRDSRLRAVFIASGMISMGWDLFTFLAPLQGVRAGLSATATGMLVGGFGLGTFAIRLLLPRLARGAGPWATMAFALLVTAAGYLAYPLLHGFVPLLCASFLLGMALGTGQPMSMTLVHLTAPPGRAGEAVGVRSMITSASQTALPVVFGALGSALGVVFVFWVMSALLAGGGAFAIRQRGSERDGAELATGNTPP